MKNIIWLTWTLETSGEIICLLICLQVDMIVIDCLSDNPETYYKLKTLIPLLIKCGIDDPTYFHWNKEVKLSYFSLIQSFINYLAGSPDSLYLVRNIQETNTSCHYSIVLISNVSWCFWEYFFYIWLFMKILYIYKETPTVKHMRSP